MTKADLITKINRELEGTTKKAVREVFDKVVGIITESLASGEKVSITGFMSMEPVEVPERECRNPHDGGKILLPAHKKIKVKIGKSLKEAVNAGEDVAGC